MGPHPGQAGESHWESVFASHTFHEIQMYYPMRVVRDGEYKLIWNIAHPLPYPFASDLWAASSFLAQYRKSLSRPMVKKPSASTSIGRNSSFSGSTRILTKQELAYDAKHADTLKLTRRSSRRPSEIPRPVDHEVVLRVG